MTNMENVIPVHTNMHNDSLNMSGMGTCTSYSIMKGLECVSL